MTTAIARALTEAAENAVPARVGTGQVRADGFSRNRRWNYDSEAREQAGETPEVDPVLWVMRIDTLDGTPHALLVNFATHPTILGHENMALSAEWPGVLQDELENTFPGAIALYTNGAEGDQAPAGARGATAFARVQDFGTRLATMAGELARDIQTQPDLAMDYHRTTPTLPPFQFTEVAHKSYGAYLDAALAALPRRAEIQILHIGKTALVGLPGEPILAVGRSVQEQVSHHGFDDVVVLGLANDYIGYIVNAREYAHGGYEVDSRSYYGPDLGDFIATHAGKTAAGLDVDKGDGD
jgi:hypothetical protein